MGWSLISAIILCVGFVTSASAKDVALILDDRSQSELRQVLDLATKAYGLQIAPSTVDLLNQLAKAPLVTEHHDDPKPEEPKDEGAPQ